MPQFPTQKDNQKSWKDRPPSKLRCYRFRVDSLEASTRFEGRWVALGALGEEARPVKFWISQKQAGSIQRSLDGEQLLCVVDVADPEKTRFVWASDNREWLESRFLADRMAQKEEEKPAQVAAPKKALKPYNPPPNRFESGEEDLPF